MTLVLGLSETAVRSPVCLTNVSDNSSTVIKESSFRSISESGSNGALDISLSTSA